MACWKAPVEFLLSVIELIFLSLLRLKRYKAKCVKTRCLQEGVGHLEPRFQGEGFVSGEYFFCFYKTRHIFLSDSANCTVLRAVDLTQYRRVTDGQTDRRTELRALRRAVKTRSLKFINESKGTKAIDELRCLTEGEQVFC